MPAASPRYQASPPPRPAPRARDAEPPQVLPLRQPTGGVRAWLQAIRVRQWTKNVLVFAAPAAAGALSRPGVPVRVAATFVVFCLLASGAYLINDVYDAAEDRRHPRKRHRPIASGAISSGRAVAAGGALIVIGLGAALAISFGLLAAAGGYALLNAAYTTWLRRIAVADIAAIAGAFVLRASAGAIAADVAISRWFIVVVSFAALLVAAGKRYADFLDPAARRSRPVLQSYTAEFLRQVIAVSCAVALGAYCLWAFEAHSGGVPWRELTIVPFTLAALRYLLLATAGDAGAPEEILFRDQFTQLAGASWVLLFGLGL